MRSVVKIPLEVTAEQAAILDAQSKIANWLYNRLLETANTLRNEYRQARAKGDQKRADEIGLVLYTERGLRNPIPEVKSTHLFVKAGYSSVLKNAALRLSKAIGDYQDSQHGRRQGPPVNGPRFRAWKRTWFSLQYSDENRPSCCCTRLLIASLTTTMRSASGMTSRTALASRARCAAP